MRLTLCGFRCYLDKTEFTFPDEELILLKGPSGVGKSTLLYAIYWILYGSGSVYPHGGYTGKTWGELEIHGFRIRRQKRPELLTVVTNSENHEDALAQSFIDKYFGTRESWVSTSYIAQNLRSPLLSASQAEKMELLNELAFAKDSPDVFLANLEQVMSKVKEKFLETRSNAEVLQSTLGTLDPNLILKDSEVEALNLELPQLTQNLETAKQKLASHYQNLGRRTEILSRLSQLPILEPVENLQSRYQQCRTEIQNYHNYQIYRQRTEIEAELTTLPPNLDRVKILQTYNFSQMELYYQLQSQVQNVNPEELTQLESKFKELQLQKQYRDLEEKINTLSGAMEITETQFQQLQNWIYRYQTSIKILTKWKLNPETLPERLQNLKYRDRHGTEIKLAHQLRSLPVLDVSGINELRDKIHRMEQSTDVKKCPHCQGYVRLLNGKLENATTSPVQPCQIQDHRQLLDRLQKYQQLVSQCPNWQEYQNLELLTELEKQELIELSSWSTESPPPTDLPTLMKCQEFTRLRQAQRQLGIIPQEFNPQELITLPQEIKKLTELIGQQRQIKFQLEKLPVPPLSREEIAVKKSELRELEPLWQRERYLLQRLNTLPVTSGTATRELSEIQTELSKLETQIKQSEDRVKLQSQLQELSIDETLPETVKGMEHRISEIQTQLRHHQEASKLYENYQKYQKLYTETMELYTKLSYLTTLKDLAIKVECDTLQATVDSINKVLEEIGSYLFEEPISIRLSLFKTLKTKDRTKPQVNFQIIYKGGEYDNVNHLSGGEGDRVSIAVTIALAQLHGSPILLLDESFGSLDTGLKEMAIKVLRHTIGKTKTIITIGHELLEGIYDHVIELK